VQIRILRFLRERVVPLANPRDLGEALTGPLQTFWKYRVGHYRVIVDLRDDELGSWLFVSDTADRSIGDLYPSRNVKHGLIRVTRRAGSQHA
jgi:hypothetical protein